jgi:hypothetical protein
LSEAASGLPRPGLESWIETDVTGPGQLTFEWSLSRAGEGQFLVKIDETPVLSDDIVGLSGQFLRAIEVPAGAHRIRWLFSTSSSNNTARAVVKAISFNSQAPRFESLAPAELNAIWSQPSSQPSLQHWVVVQPASALGVGLGLQSTNPDRSAPLDLAIDGPAVVAFELHSSLQFAVDGVAWTEPLPEHQRRQSIVVGRGRHHIQWNLISSRRSLATLVDAISIAAVPDGTIPDAIGTPDYGWFHHWVSPQWGVRTGVSNDGDHGFIAAGRFAAGSLLVRGPGRLLASARFTDPDPNYSAAEPLALFVNGDPIASSEAGLGIWHRVSVPINGESELVTFMLQAGNDSALAWLDRVELQPKAFVGWLDSYGLTPGEAEADADVDHDGSTNFIEYAFGSHPLNAHSTPQIEGLWQTGEISFRIRTDDLLPEADYQFELSSDLREWTVRPVLGERIEGGWMFKMLQPEQKPAEFVRLRAKLRLP